MRAPSAEHRAYKWRVRVQWRSVLSQIVQQKGHQRDFRSMAERGAAGGQQAHRDADCAQTARGVLATSAAGRRSAVWGSWVPPLGSGARWVPFSSSWVPLGARWEAGRFEMSVRTRENDAA